MKIHDVEQGTPEWLQLRLGIPTGSQFDRLLTPKTRKPAAARFKYRAELLAEWLLGYPIDNGSQTIWMERGTGLEAEARRWYEFEKGVTVQRVGFVTRDDGQVGCSPDGLVGDDGVLEIKCPSAVQHVLYLLGEEPDYLGQCQGSLYITGRRWVDFLSYNPALPPKLIRIHRDEEYIAALADVLDSFLAGLELDKAALGEYRAEVRPGMVA